MSSPCIDGVDWIHQSRSKSTEALMIHIIEVIVGLQSTDYGSPSIYGLARVWILQYEYNIVVGMCTPHITPSQANVFREFHSTHNLYIFQCRF